MSGEMEVLVSFKCRIFVLGQQWTKHTIGHSLVSSFLHFSLHYRLNPPDLVERRKTWDKISSLLTTYETLYLTDQVFLVEALEHVQFGQLSAAANVVQKLTRDSLDAQHK